MGDEPIIYTGPTNKALGLRNRAIYSAEPPEHLRETIATNSALANFFVPLSRYAKVLRKFGARAGAVSAPLARGALPTRQIGPPIKKR